jgi:hypothetical protein
MTEQLNLTLDSAALDECGVVDRNHGKAEDTIATCHESAQTMAHDGSAGGVSTQPSLRSFHLHCARTWLGAARRGRLSGYMDQVVYWAVIWMAQDARRDASLPPN